MTADNTGNQQLIGIKVWIPDEENAWIQGTVQSVSSESNLLHVMPKNGIIQEVSLESVRISNTFEDNEHITGFLDVTDLTSLTHLHEPSLLEALSERFKANKIYTNTGPILIAVNPFKLIEGLYSTDLLLNYYTTGIAQSQISAVDPNMALPPHVYKTADSAYRSLLDDDSFLNMDNEENDETNLEDFSFTSHSQNQSILVSGESGAGKTESTKHIMNYLATVSNQKAKGNKQKIADMVLKSNPILESFGNARTIRNDNSSRFGKFIEMQFDYKGQLVGSRIKTYLLEKVRINSQMKKERNYHIFYQFFKGSTSEMKAKFSLDKLDLTLKSCNLTNMSGCFSRQDGVKDERKFEEMLNAMQTMNFSSDEIDSVLLVISILMHFSNITFVDKLFDGNEGSVIDKGNKSNSDRIALISDLISLKTNYENFEKSLTKRKRIVGNEVFEHSLSGHDANLAKEAVIKTIYSRLFAWIVQRINSSIEFNPSLSTSFDTNMELSFIGVLDIFGFEVFDNNSFEQLCINYANETLQQQFNHFVFKVEQQEYKKEQIVWNNIVFSDNTDILNLIHSKPISILSLLNEQCLFPNSTNKTLFNKYFEKLNDNKYFSVSNKQKVNFQFCITHYAGKVCYNTVNFIEKNQDILFQEALDLLQTSTNSFINELFPIGEKNEINAKSIQTVTVGTQFKNQLQDLMNVIKLTKPHYIRCLKPNDLNTPYKLNRIRLLDQLRYSGVLEAVKVSRLGYPIRMLHYDFLKRYQYITKQTSLEDICIETFGFTNIEDFQIGLTKIFLRQATYELIEQKRNLHRKTQVVKLQSYVRMYLQRNIYLKTIRSVVTIQCFIRKCQANRCVQQLRYKVNATRIQKNYRMYVKRSRFKKIVYLSLTVQKIYRGFKVRRKLLEERTKSSVETIQKFLRMGKERRQFLYTRKLVTKLQQRWRIRMAKKQLKQLRIEAKQVGNLEEKIAKLKQKVVELEIALDDEKAKNEELENKLESTDMNEENVILKEQVLRQQRENTQLLKLVEELRKENNALKNQSATSEEVDTIQEFEENGDESLSDKDSNDEDNIEAELDYWTQKMGSESDDFIQPKANAVKSPPVKIPEPTPAITQTPSVPKEIELKISELEKENEDLRSALQVQKQSEPKIVETTQLIRAKQEVNEIKVAMGALAQENKDYKRANFELQENMHGQIERVCKAENRAIELEEENRVARNELTKLINEKKELEKDLVQLNKKTEAMAVLGEQTSAVKIALAKRLEELLADTKRKNIYIASLKKKLSFFNDTNQALQREMDRLKKSKKEIS